MASAWPRVLAVALLSAGHMVTGGHADPCACQKLWVYRGPNGKGPMIEHHDCARTPDWVGHMWCYVNSSSCRSATPSNVKGDTRKYKECGACACQDVWSYAGADGSGQKEQYQECAETPDWPGHQWCYVKDRMCPFAKMSTVKGNTRKYRECGTCACQDTWTYRGPFGKDPEVRYQGCSETPDRVGHQWCYVNSDMCVSAVTSSVTGEQRKYKECGACACQDAWGYKGPKGKDHEVLYHGCSGTPDWFGHEWCYVNSPMCPFAKFSKVEGEGRRWRECGNCACQDAWIYRGPDGTGPPVEYHGCAETPDWKGHNWCYVNNEMCQSAKDSKVRGETRRYKDCGPCACQDTWVYRGAKRKGPGVFYQGCAQTPDWGDEEWCYVNDGSMCRTAKTSKIPGETRKYKKCGACACQDTWTYRGPKGEGPEVRYAGCAETPDSEGREWCFVNSGMCGSAETKADGDSRKYRECGSGELKFSASSVAWGRSLGRGGRPLASAALAGAALLVSFGLVLMALRRARRGSSRQCQIPLRRDDAEVE